MTILRSVLEEDYQIEELQRIHKQFFEEYVSDDEEFEDFLSDQVQGPLKSEKSLYAKSVDNKSEKS